MWALITKYYAQGCYAIIWICKYSVLEVKSRICPYHQAQKKSKFHYSNAHSLHNVLYPFQDWGLSIGPNLRPCTSERALRAIISGRAPEVLKRLLRNWCLRTLRACTLRGVRPEVFARRLWPMVGAEVMYKDVFLFEHYRLLFASNISMQTFSTRVNNSLRKFF
jgi:hypothetical protein